MESFAYLASSVLCIGAIACLANQRTARLGEGRRTGSMHMDAHTWARQRLIAVSAEAYVCVCDLRQLCLAGGCNTPAPLPAAGNTLGLIGVGGGLGATLGALVAAPATYAQILGKHAGKDAMR